MPGQPDPYKILQVDPEAEDEVIQAAYRRLAQKYHPDLASGADAVARMVAINAAWELIGEPNRRAAYDRSTPRRTEDAASPAAPCWSPAVRVGSARIAPTGCTPASGNGLERLDVGSFDQRRWLRRGDDARPGGPRRCRSAAR